MEFWNKRVRRGVVVYETQDIEWYKSNGEVVVNDIGQSAVASNVMNSPVHLRRTIY